MPDLPIPETYWVEENRLLAGQYPGSFYPETMRRRINLFLEAGVTAFIDLTEPEELKPYETTLKDQAQARGINVTYRRFPIHDYSVPSSETMTAILDAIDEAINNGRCVYVHCWGGVGRTGMVVGCHLVRHGLTNRQAAAEVDRLFKTRPDHSSFPRSPESDEQVDFILNWWDEEQNKKTFCEG